MNLNNERYPEPIANFSEWYKLRMEEINAASDPAEIEVLIGRIRQYADARWCFPNRLTDAQDFAAKVRKRRGWDVRREAA